MPYWPGSSWSPFMAMHIEQPDSRHSAPAALKTLSEALALGLLLDLLRCPGRRGRAALGDVPAAQDRSRRAHVLDPAVGARADEDDVELLAGDRLAGLEAHVGERPLEVFAEARLDVPPESGSGR
jgi:hypothetical protein